MILTQVIILLVFSIVNPPCPIKYVEQDGEVVIHGAICNTDTNIYFITLGSYKICCGFLWVHPRLLDLKHAR